MVIFSSAMIATFSDSLILRTFLRAGVAELGDKTFFIIASLSAWSPFLGLGQSRDAPLAQKGAVFCGAVVAQFTAVLFVCYDVALSASTGSFTMGLVATGLCLACALKAYYDNRQAQPSKEELNPFLCDKGEEPSAEADGQSWNTYASTLVQHDVRDAEGGYGATPSPGIGGIFEGPPPDDCPGGVKLAAVSLVTLALVITVEITDRSYGVMADGAHSGFGFGLGAMLGLVVVDLIAFACAFILERYCEDSTVLFAVALAFLCASLLTATQAILKAPGLDTALLASTAT